MTSDELLLCISLAQQGDRHALGRLAAFARPLIERQLLRYSLSDEDRRDVAQSAMMQVVRRIGSFRGYASFTTWLFRVTANEALMWMRSHRRLRAHLVHEVDLDDAEGLQQLAVGTQEDNSVLEQEREAVVRSALAQLPEHYRDVVTAHYHQDLGLQQIAEQLAVTESAVRSRLHRARTRLRGLLSDASVLWEAAFVV
ncbi:MAG: sigma-70 family RNA polymerase sigma factor [Myxococcales bacterium]|nr:sigma-70 family RNA polymerase sigma factor [Polyangiaceae bacterium]MDW8249776.1 sigma-70 family RNA polymerase sigma factor [Myxococcales bacterium]